MWTQSRHCLNETVRKRKKKHLFLFIHTARLLAHGVRLYFFLCLEIRQPCPAERDRSGEGGSGSGEKKETEAAKVEICEELIVTHACSTRPPAHGRYTRGGLSDSVVRLGVNENAVNSGFPHSLPFVQDEVQAERIVHAE